MERYSIEFKNQSKEMVIGYEAGKLALMTIPDWFTEQQINWIRNEVPVFEKDISILDGYKFKFKVTKVNADLSFEKLWDDYGYKVGKKDRCKMLWRLMSDTDKTNCLKSIPRYNRWLLDKNIERVYPETYLSQRRWENEFKIL